MKFDDSIRKHDSKTSTAKVVLDHDGSMHLLKTGSEPEIKRANSRLQAPSRFVH